MSTRDAAAEAVYRNCCYTPATRSPLITAHGVYNQYSHSDNIQGPQCLSLDLRQSSR